MRRNWYAAGLLLLLLAAVFSAGVYMDTSTQRLDQKLTAACACMEQGEFTQAEAAFRDAADYAQQASSLWLLMMRGPANRPGRSGNHFSAGFERLPSISFNSSIKVLTSLNWR